MRLQTLKKREDFLKVAGSGRKWITPGFIIQVKDYDTPLASSRGPGSLSGTSLMTAESQDNTGINIDPAIKSRDDGSSISVGYTVSKKADKAAVRRNRIKRRLRAAVREIMQERAKPAQYVLIGRREALDLPYEKLCGDIKWALKRLECLR